MHMAWCDEVKKGDNVFLRGFGMSLPIVKVLQVNLGRGRATHDLALLVLEEKGTKM